MEKQAMKQSACINHLSTTKSKPNMKLTLSNSTILPLTLSKTNLNNIQYINHKIHTHPNPNNNKNINIYSYGKHALGVTAKVKNLCNKYTAESKTKHVNLNVDGNKGKVLSDDREIQVRRKQSIKSREIQTGNIGKQQDTCYLLFMRKVQQKEVNIEGLRDVFDLITIKIQYKNKQKGENLQNQNKNNMNKSQLKRQNTKPSLNPNNYISLNPSNKPQLNKKKLTQNHSWIDLKPINSLKNNFTQMQSQIKPNYQNINLKILELTNYQLIQISKQIIQKYLPITNNSGTIQFSKFLKQINSGYNIVSYHNFAHGFSLLHMLYHLIKSDNKFSSLYSKEQIGFALIAALGHDLKHQGTNNGYQIKMKTQLAVITQNEAVLQKLHIKILLKLVNDYKIDVMYTKNPQQIKQLITRLILATDVAKHFKNVQKLKSIHQSNQFDPKNNQHRYFILEQAFHACDIGNPCLEYNEYINWAALLMYQFNSQTILQQKNKIQITQMLRYKGLKQFYKGQIGFVNVLVLPLWKQLNSFFNGFNFYVKNIEHNLVELKNNVEKQQAKVKK